MSISAIGDKANFSVNNLKFNEADIPDAQWISSNAAIWAFNLDSGIEEGYAQYIRIEAVEKD